MSTTDYVKGLVKMHDKNGDNMLQPEEQKDLHGRAKDADLDKDGVITINELVTHLSTPTSGSPTPSSGTGASSTKSPTDSGKSAGSDSGHHGGKGDSGGKLSKVNADGNAKRVFTALPPKGGAANDAANKHRSYRFTPAPERLPKTLPSFFSRDKNGDGQVEMSEYSQRWSKSTVDEFRRYDKNDDGVITAKEATGAK
jgi:hypothetical protein